MDGRCHDNPDKTPLYKSALCFKHIFAVQMPLTIKSMHYQFELSDTERNQLFDGVKSARLGDSMELIKRKAGAHFTEKTLCTKKGRFVEYELFYYIKRVRLNCVNANDQYICFVFNIDRKLEQILYNAMEPIAGEVIEIRDDPPFYWVYTRPPIP
jgi:hypothetical protein